MEIKEVESFLKNTRYEKFIGHIQTVELKNYVYKDLFKIGNDTLGYFALKIRDASQKNVLDSIEILSALNDPENVVNEPPRPEGRGILYALQTRRGSICKEIINCGV
jgi:hypothetical protein